MLKLKTSKASFARAFNITEEPSAVIPLARICVGTAQVTGRSTTTMKKNDLPSI